MSRRLTQRRFPPGSLMIQGGHVYIVVGWTPVAPRAMGWRGRMTERTWECLLVTDQRLEHVSWERARECATLDEWEGAE